MSFAGPTRRIGRPRRPGGVTAFLLVASVVLLGALAIAVDYAYVWQSRQELQNSADAAALAAVASLVDDDYLLGDPARTKLLMDVGRARAVRFAALNPVQGRPLVLGANPTNDRNGDIVFGRVATPLSRTFIAAENVTDPNNLFLTRLNAVIVHVKRTRAGGNPLRTLVGFGLALRSADVQVVAAATLDQDVYGFRPVGGRPVPLAPIALRSDPAGNDPRSWENQVARGQGPDVYRFDRASHALVPDPVGDGLHEFTVTLAPPGGPDNQANGALIQIGTTTPAAQQLRQGVSAADIGGQFALDGTNRLVVAGSVEAPAPGSQPDEDLRAALEELRASGAQRAWPLYVSAGGGEVELAGFVAARVAAVGPAGQPLSFTLQPTFLATPSALTDVARRGVNGAAVPNPYIARIRLVG